MELSARNAKRQRTARRPATAPPVVSRATLVFMRRLRPASRTGPVDCCGAECTQCQAPANGSATCDGSSCGFTCNAGFHAQGSICEPNDTLACCGAGCVQCQAPANASATCDGNSCDWVCDGGYHKCGDGCADDTSVNSCGSSCTPCKVSAHGSATCDARPASSHAMDNYEVCALWLLSTLGDSYCGLKGQCTLYLARFGHQ